MCGDMDEKSILQAAAPIETVSLNYRYVSAWNEVNSRIAQRQNAVTIFVTLSSIIVTVLLSGNHPVGSSSNQLNTFALLDPALFSLLLPVISIVFGFLNYKHDKTIALLRYFLSECEALTSKNYPAIQVIDYNSSDYFRKYADSARRFHDYSCLALIVIFNVLGVLVIEKAYPSAFEWTGWPIFAYCSMAIFSIFLVMRSTWWPYRFDRAC